MANVDKQPPKGAELPSKTETDKILKMFDRETPS